MKAATIAVSLATLAVVLLVLSLSRGAGASDGSTTLSLSAPNQVDVQKQFALTAVLLEHTVPLPDQELVFSRETTFGAIEVGRALTDSIGTATVTVSLPSSGTYVFTVAFAGNVTLRSSLSTSTVVAAGPAPPAPDFLPLLAIGVVAAVVVGSVWGCYAFVLTQLWEIRKDGGRSPAGLGGSKFKR